MAERSSGRLAYWMALLMVVAIGVAIVVLPVFILMPFKAQTLNGVAWSFQLRRWSPVITIVSLLLSLFLIWKLWSGGRWWSRTISILLLIPLLGAVWFSRQNHFEWMFHPLPDASYATAGQAKNVADSDMVMSVALNGEVVAFPVREMAYHHVVNDSIGGRPITATY